MTISITESDMQFGPFAESDILQIETCNSYQKIQQGVAIAEFVLSRPTSKSPCMLWVVEAKSSSPRPSTQPAFDEFIHDICEKFINSMHLFLAGVLGRNTDMQDEMPSGMHHITAANADFRFILVIKGHKEDWLQPLQDALKLHLKPLVKTWKLNPSCVVVLNDATARDQHLIS